MASSDVMSTEGALSVKYTSMVGQDGREIKLVQERPAEGPKNVK